MKETSGQEEKFQSANIELGYFHLDRQRWDKALKCFEIANHFEGQIEALTRMEDYEHLDKVVA